MEKEFVPYEIALALKELGFDELCFGRYIYDGRGKEWFLIQTQQTKSASVIFEGARSVDGISVAAPLYQQAFRWFREKYVLDSIVQPTYSTKYQYRVFNVETKSKVQVYGDYMGKEFKTYEEAELACLIKLIEIVKNK
jgi:hypothetical protein